MRRVNFMKKFTCLLFLLFIFAMMFFVSCGKKDEVDFFKPVYGEYEKIEFIVSKTDSQTADVVKKVITDKDDIAKIVNYMNNAELTPAKELYTGNPVGGYSVSVSFYGKDGEYRSFKISGEKTIYTNDNVPFYTNETFEKDMLELYNSIDAEEQVVNK